MNGGFDGYYEATEQAFAQEKEDMVYRVDGLDKFWEDAIKLDEDAVTKCKELMALKNLLTKGHLQILRTREECMHMQLKNAQMRFHVRQLQSEVFRLLPYSHSDVPSTEYHMTLDQKIFRPSKQPRIEADEEHMNDLNNIHQQWERLCELQKETFTEEMKNYNEDTEQWEKFALDFRTQNHDTHALIDSQLGDISRKLVALKAAHEETLSTKNDQLDGLERKHKRLNAQTQSTMSILSEKSILERKQARNNASEQCNIVRGRVREIERKNLQRFSAMKEKDNQLQEKELELLRITDQLSEKVRNLNLKNAGLSEEGLNRIRKLEEQLNAVISAAAAIKDSTYDEECRILGVVSAAVGKHGKSASSVEKLHMRIENMGNKLNEVTKLYEMK